MNREFKYESLGMKNYILVNVGDGKDLIDYYSSMMENNSIKGLLSFYRQNTDGDVCLYYDITGYKRLSDALKRQVFSNEECIKIIRNIINVFDNIEHYFLSASMLVFDLDYIYIDNKLDVSFILIPIEDSNESVNDRLFTFFREVIGQNMINYNGSTMHVYTKYFFGDSFDYNEFKEQFKEEIKPAQVKSNVQKQVNPSVNIQNSEKVQQGSELQNNSKVDRPSPKKVAEEVKVDNGKEGKYGFSIPGMPNAPKEETKKNTTKNKDKKKNDKKEKKSVFSLFGKKENKDSIENKEIIEKKEDAPKIKHNIPSSSVQFANNQIESNNKNNNWQGTQVFDGSSSSTSLFGEEIDGISVGFYHNSKLIEVNSPEYKIGRENTDYIIPSNVISKHHLTIITTKGECFVVDENSSNGTFINSNKITPFTEYKIADGDKIRIGREEITFSIR